MQIEDDEILQGFIEESLEHLADIENDLLAIEEAGENIDEDLVNKVFRAAHSIKGGAGFMGLTVIQELSHAMENVLGMIRGKKLVPNPDIINVLLLAADQLQKMVEDVQSSNDVDVTEHIIPLNSITETKTVPGGQASHKASPAKPEKTVKAKSKPEPEPEIEPELESEADTPPDYDLREEPDLEEEIPPQAEPVAMNVSKPSKSPKERKFFSR